MFPKTIQFGAQTIGLVSFNRLPAPEHYDPNSAVYNATIKKPRSQLKFIVDSFEKVAGEHKEEMATYDQQAAFVFGQIQKDTVALKRIGHAFAVVKAQKDRNEDNKKTIQDNASEEVKHFREKQEEKLVADAILAGKTNKFASDTCEAARAKLGLETPEQWRALFVLSCKDGITQKFIELDNDGFRKSPHCPDPTFNTHRTVNLGGKKESKKSYFGRLIKLLDFTPPASLLAPVAQTPVPNVSVPISVPAVSVPPSVLVPNASVPAIAALPPPFPEASRTFCKVVLQGLPPTKNSARSACVPFPKKPARRRPKETREGTSQKKKKVRRNLLPSVRAL